MEVRIRLQKFGRSATKHYNYRIVAISRTSARDSRHLELLGHYDPSRKPATLHIDFPKLDAWVKKGAQMSDTVRSLVKQAKKKS